MDERLFLSFFDNLIEKSGNIEGIVNNIIDQIKEYDKIKGNIGSKGLEGCTNGVDEPVTDCSNDNSENSVLNNKLNNKIIENKKYAYKLINDNNKYLQYALNRLTVGISTNNNSSRANFSHCFHIILKRFRKDVNFSNLVELFLNVYNVNSNTLSSQIKYIFLGRLEVLVQLYKVNFFKNLKDTGVLVRIVESLFEVYEHKTYFQDSVVCLLMLIVGQIEVNEEVYGAIFGKIEKGVNENNLLVLLGVCLNRRVGKSEWKRVVKWRDLEVDGTSFGDVEVVLNLFNGLSNNYPIINLYTYILSGLIGTTSYSCSNLYSYNCNGNNYDGNGNNCTITSDNNDHNNNYKDNKVELLKRLINVINYNLEERSSINNVKFNLSLVLILIRNLNSYALLELLFESLGTYLRVVRRYYRHSNESNLKQFVNSYIEELCNTFKSGSLLHCNSKDCNHNNDQDNDDKENTKNNEEDRRDKIVNVLKLDRNLDKNVEVYVRVYNELLRLFVDSRVNPSKQVEEEGVDEFRVRFKLLMALGEDFGNVTVFGKVIRCLVTSLGSESERLLVSLLENENDSNRNYVLYVSRLVVGNNPNLLVNYLNNVINNTSVEGTVRNRHEQELTLVQQSTQEKVEMYVLMLTRYLGGLVNKVSKVGESHYRLLSEQFEVLEGNLKGVNVEELESLKSKLVKLTEKKEGNFKFIILLATTFIVLVNSCDLTDISQLTVNYFSSVYSYLNKPKSKSQKELLKLLTYHMFTQDSGSSVSRLFSLMNKLIWKLFLRDEEFVNGAWEYVFRSIRDFEVEFESCKEEELEIVFSIDRQDDTDGIEEDDNNDTDVEDDTDNNETDIDQHNHNDTDQDEKDEDEVVLNNYDDIYNHLINDDQDNNVHSRSVLNKKKLDLDNEVNRKVLGYELLLDLLNSGRLKSVPPLSLEEVFGVMKDFVASSRSSHNGKMNSFIGKLSELYSKRKDEGKEAENGDQCSVRELEEDEVVMKMMKILLFNKSVKNAIVQFVNIIVGCKGNRRINREVFVNYFVFLALTRKTNVNLNVLKELYRNCRCQLNLFKLISVEHNKVLSKSMIKSQILLLITNLINTNNYYHINSCCGSNNSSNCDNNNNNNNSNNNKEDNNSNNDINSDYKDVYNGNWRRNVESEDLRAILSLVAKMDKSEGNKQYAKSVTNCVNSLYSYLKRQKLVKGELEKTLSEISSNVKSKEHNKVKKYLNNITFL